MVLCYMPDLLHLSERMLAPDLRYGGEPNPDIVFNMSYLAPNGQRLRDRHAII